MDFFPDLDATLERLQLLQELAVGPSWSTNLSKRRAAMLPVWDTSLVDSMIYLLSMLPLPSLEEEILQALKGHRYQLSQSQGSVVLVGFIPRTSPKAGVMPLLTEVLKIFQDNPKISHRPVLVGGGQHPYDKDPWKLETLYDVNQASRVKMDACGDSGQFNLVSIKSLKNAVKTDLRKYQVYLMGLKSRLRNLERRAATVTKDLERANLELEALKQKNRALVVLEQAELTSQEPSGHLTCQSFVGDLRGVPRDGSDPIWFETLQRLKHDASFEQRSPTHNHQPEEPSVRPQTRGVLKNCMLQCQALIDTLVDKLNKQITKTEKDVIEGVVHLIQTRKGRRSERKNLSVI